MRLLRQREDPASLELARHLTNIAIKDHGSAKRCEVDGPSEENLSQVDTGFSPFLPYYGEDDALMDLCERLRTEEAQQTNGYLSEEEDGEEDVLAEAQDIYGYGDDERERQRSQALQDAMQAPFVSREKRRREEQRAAGEYGGECQPSSDDDDA